MKYNPNRKSLTKFKPKKKILPAIILAVVVALPIYLYLTKNKTQTAEAGWWDDNWTYRKQINVTNGSGSDLTAFQVKILDNKDLSADITAGKIQADLDDLRFTDISGNILPYWIEDTTAASVDVWVKAPSVPTTGGVFFMYYGNAQATSAQNGNQVFEFFDDFNDNSIDSNKWLEVDNGTDGIKEQNQRLEQNFPVGTNYTTGTQMSQNNRLNRTSGLVFETDFYRISSQTVLGVHDSGSGPDYVDLVYSAHHTSGSSPSVYVYEDGTGRGTFGDYWKDSTWQTLKFVVKPTAGATYYLKDKGTSSYTQYYDSTYSSESPLGFGFAIHYGSEYIDNFRARKYASTEPSAGTPATEEKGGAPVAYWSFDEGRDTTAYDASSNRNNGTLTNMASTADPNSGWQSEDKCVSGKCLKFDGTDDYTDVGNSNNYKFGTGDFTVSFWMKANVWNHGSGEPTEYMTIMGNANYSSNWDGFHFSRVGTYWSNYLGVPEGSIMMMLGNGTNNEAVSSAVALSPNTWYHVEGVRSNGTAYLYLNGILKSSRAINYNVTVNRSLMIGRNNDNTYKRNFNGFIDEPKVYSYARSASQIAKDYNAGLSGMGKANEGTSASIGDKSDKWLTDGLVGHWKMDEASWNGTGGEVKNASGDSNNNGTSANGPTTGAGKFGNGGVFDGTDDYVNVGNTDSLKITSDLTISAWIKTAVAGKAIITKGNWTNNDGYLFFIGGDSTLRLYIDDGVNPSGGAVSPGTVTDNVWHHVVGVYTPSNSIKLYIDGALVATSTSGIPASIANTGFPFRIGSNGSGAVNFGGSIDEPRIYNRALSPKEVSDLYNYAPGPVGYWNMDDATGTTAKDLSGNGNDGTLTGGPTWAQGKFGKAASLGTSSPYINVPNSSSLNITNAITIEAWVKFNSIGGGTYGYNEVLAKVGSSTYQYDFGIRSATRWRFGFGNSTSEVSNLPALSTNQWYHLTGVSSVNGVHKYYVNGVEVASATPATSVTSVSDDMRIGHANSSGFGTNYFDGIIDEVKIYNYARTQKQITEDMNGGHPVGGSPVGSQVGYWKFDEGNGGTANNSGNGGSGLNGTISGATWSNDGKFGKALGFNGSSNYVTVPSNSAFAYGTGDFTWAMWINSSSFASGNNYVIDHGANGGLIQYYSNYLSYYNSTAGRLNSSQLNLNTWYHAVVLRRSGTTYFYINGKLVNSFVDSKDYPAQSVTIGNYGGGGYGWNGLIDEVKIYNYALTDSEIQLDYNQGKSLVLGSKGTESNGVTPSNSASRAYCPPGNTEGNCGVGLNPAPVGEWKMDEGTSTTANDTSGNGSNGTLTNGPTWAQGKAGKAVSFDGSDDYVQLTPALLDSRSAFTVESWIKPSTITGSGYLSKTIMAQKYTGFGIGGTTYAGAESSVVLSLQTTSSGAAVCYSNTKVVVNQWQHVVGVYNGTATPTLYINGIPASSVTCDTTPPSSTYAAGITARIGTGNASSYNGYFQGFIDEVKIYNYARTPAQIAWDFNQGKPVGWWKMDEGQGTSVYDWSGNGNNGTMTNMDGATDWVAGKNNGALDFDGSDDWVDIPNVSQYFSGKSEVSVSLWVKNRNAGQLKSILNFPGGVIFSMEYFSGGTPAYIYFNNNNPTGVPITTNEWTHIVATFQNGTVKAYKNGGLVDTKTNSSSTIGSVSGNLNLAKSSWTGPSYANIQLDDVRVYNYALSAEQAKQVFNNGAIEFR